MTPEDAYCRCGFPIRHETGGPSACPDPECPGEQRATPEELEAAFRRVRSGPGGEVEETIVRRAYAARMRGLM